MSDKNVIGKIYNLVSAVINNCPDAKVIVAGVFLLQDNPHLDKTIDSINHVLQTSAKRHSKLRAKLVKGYNSKQL